MFYVFRIQILTPWVGFILRKGMRNGVIYVQYEYARNYNPKKKYNSPKHTTIRKICMNGSSHIYLNPNYLKLFPEVALLVEKNRTESSGCLWIGNYLVIQKLIWEALLDRIVADLYGDPRGARLFLDSAAHYIITQYNAGQYYPDYTDNHPLFAPEFMIYSDSAVSRFRSEN